MALIEIGEAARHLDEELLSAAPEIDWRAMIGMRNFLVHHYFDTDHAVVAHVIDHELGPLIRHLSSRRPELGWRRHADVLVGSV